MKLLLSNFFYSVTYVQSTKQANMLFAGTAHCTAMEKLHVHLCFNRENHPSKTKLQISDKYKDKRSIFFSFLQALHTAQWWTKLQLQFTKMEQTLKTLQTNRETMQENMLFAGTAQCTLVDKTPIAPC